MRPSPVRLAETDSAQRTFGTVGVALVRKDWCVIPVDGNKPCIPWREFQGRIPSELEAARWARDYPGANVALVLGHGVVALDFDADDVFDAMIIGDAANACFGRSPLERVGLASPCTTLPGEPYRNSPIR